MSLTNVEISGNQTTSSYGGGFHNNGMATLINVTVSGNTAAQGGGLSNSGAMSVKNSTIAANSDVGNFAAGISNFGALTVENTIVSNAGAANCAGAGTFTSAGHNLENGNSCSFNTPGDLVDTDAELGPLAANSGTTYTHALLGSSPAVDTGNNATCPATDQRGVARPFEGDGNGTAVCDIGAYERDFVQFLTFLPGVLGQ